MHVEAIHVREPEAALPTTPIRVRAVAGKGIEGDRYYFADGAEPGMALTLVEAPVVAEVGLLPGETRRQLTVSHLGLNDLIGRRFRVGEVECRGVMICEPCLHLQQVTRRGILKALVHRGGLNADILTDGWISIGDVVEPIE